MPSRVFSKVVLAVRSSCFQLSTSLCGFLQLKIKAVTFYPRHTIELDSLQRLISECHSLCGLVSVSLMHYSALLCYYGRILEAGYFRNTRGLFSSHFRMLEVEEGVAPYVWHLVRDLGIMTSQCYENVCVRAITLGDRKPEVRRLEDILLEWTLFSCLRLSDLADSTFTHRVISPTHLLLDTHNSASASCVLGPEACTYPQIFLVCAHSEYAD